MEVGARFSNTHLIFSCSCFVIPQIFAVINQYWDYKFLVKVYFNFLYYFVVLYPKMSVVRLLLIEKRKFVDSAGSTDFWAKGFLVETIRLRKIFSPDNW